MSHLRQDKSGNQPVTNQEEPPSGSVSGHRVPSPIDFEDILDTYLVTNQPVTNQEELSSGSGSGLISHQGQRNVEEPEPGATDQNHTIPVVARALNLITDTFDALDFGSLVAEPVNTIGGRRHLVEDPVLSEIVRQEIHLQRLEDEGQPEQEDTSSVSSLSSLSTQPNPTSSGVSSLATKSTQDILCEEVRQELLADLIGVEEEEKREPQPGNQEVWCEEARQEILAQLEAGYNDWSTEAGPSFSTNNDSYSQEDESSQQHASYSDSAPNSSFQSVEDVDLPLYEDLLAYLEAQNGESTQDSGIIVDFLDLTESVPQVLENIDLAIPQEQGELDEVDEEPNVDLPKAEEPNKPDSPKKADQPKENRKKTSSAQKRKILDDSVIAKRPKYNQKETEADQVSEERPRHQTEDQERPEQGPEHQLSEEQNQSQEGPTENSGSLPHPNPKPEAEQRRKHPRKSSAVTVNYGSDAVSRSDTFDSDDDDDDPPPPKAPVYSTGWVNVVFNNTSFTGPVLDKLPTLWKAIDEVKSQNQKNRTISLEDNKRHLRKETEAAIVAYKERQAALRRVASKRQLEEPTGDSGKVTQHAVQIPRLSGYTGFGIYNPPPALEYDQQLRHLTPKQLELQQRYRKQQEELWIRQQEVDKKRAEHQKQKEEEEKEKVRLKKLELDIQRQLRLQQEQYQLKLKEEEELRVKQLDPNYKPPIKVTKAELLRQKIQRNKQKKEEEKRQFREQQLGLQKQQPSKELMQNDMVSIPAANMNGGLKAASAGSAVVTASGVPSSVLANAPRVFLTNASSAFMVGNRTGSATVTATATAASSSTGSAAGAVRYFSQFGKIQKSPNLDTILMANGIGTPIKTTNGSLNTTTLLTSNKMDFLDSDADLSTVIIEEPESEDSRKSAASDPSSQQQQQELQLEKKSLNPEAQPKSDEPLELTQLSNSNSATGAPGQAAGPDEPQPELDIVINNVVCSFSVRCHLKLRDIALNGANVEYRRENGMVTMKLRHPYTTASIWSSGRITCTGATSEPMAKVAARRYARCLGKLGFPTRFQNFRIVNVLGTCSMPWAIKIVNFSERHRENASYEPELHPGVTYKMRDPKATLKIFSTGSITVTAASVNDVEAAIQHIYPLVFEFRKQRSAEELLHLRSKQRNLVGADPSELEELIINENKVAGDNNIFVNTQPAHGKSESSTSATALSTSSINSVQRLKQFENYVHVVNQTQDERRHIPFQGDSSAKSSSTAAGTASSSSTGDNICANARRRATECWASKLQNKRTRYNNIAPTEPATSSSGTAVVRNPLKAAALANAKPRNATGTSGKIPVSQVLKQSSSRARNAHLQQQQQQQQQHQQQHLEQQQVVQVVQCPKVRSSPAFEPTDFEIDDLIEEEETNEFGLPY